jgi:hypothetical protein
VSLYDENVQRIFKTTKCPYRGFVVDMVEHQDYLELRVYQENIAEYSQEQKLGLAEYLYTLQSAIRLTGVKCHIQGSLDPVPYRKWEGNN